MSDDDFLADRFEAHRVHLKSVAYQMLGSLSEADDAVQEAWLRLSRNGADGVGNLSGWLTTVVGRVCLDMLRSRKALREEPLELRMPDPVVASWEGGADPEREALVADSVGLALLVVLETLGPAERLTFVLHDMFAMPFEEIAPLVGRSPAATRQLASRARRRVRGAAPRPDGDPGQRRRVVNAFLDAAREGEFEALVAVLDPDVVLRSDTGTGLRVVHGATRVAGSAITFRKHATGLTGRPALVNGAPGIVNVVGERVMSIMSFTITDGRIVEIDILSDSERLDRIDLPALDA